MTGASLRSGPRSHYEGFKGMLKAVGTGQRGWRSLIFEEAREAMRALLYEEVTDAQAGAFLIALRIKGEDPEELAGLVQALRDAALTEPVTRPNLVACAGAYDGVVDHPNLSVAAGCLAAAAGASVVMHCGSPLGPKRGVVAADVISALGGDGRPSPDASRARLERHGICLVHAGEAIPGWERLAALRDELGLRGPVHTAEKLVDHFGARRFVVGFTHVPYGPRIVGALGLLGADDAVGIRGIEGSDVVRPGRPQAHELNGAIELPERHGLRLRDRGGAGSSAAITRAVLTGEDDGANACSSIVSAALRLRAAGVIDDPATGIRVAEKTLSSGAAAEKLAALIA